MGTYSSWAPYVFGFFILAVLSANAVLYILKLEISYVYYLLSSIRPILRIIYTLFMSSLWLSFLLLVFTLTSSPYNSHQAVKVLKNRSKTQRRASLTAAAIYDDSAVKSSPKDVDETKDDEKDEKEEDVAVKTKKEENTRKERKESKASSHRKIDSSTKQKYKRRKMFRSYLRMFFTHGFIVPVIFGSSLFINLLQLIVRLSHPIFGYKTRMWLSSWLKARWTPAFLFGIEFWPNLRYRVRIENPELFKFVKKSNIYLIPNHAESPFDWLASLSFADVLGRNEGIYLVMKRLFVLVPMMGWTSLLAGSLALHRKWDDDKERLRALFADMQNVYKQPWCFISYPEGTRQNAKKLKDSQEFAKKRGYTVLNNLLQPRVKGFAFFCEELGQKRKAVEYVVDMTNLYIPKPPPLKRFLLTGRLHDSLEMVIRIYKISDLPEGSEQIGNWLRDMYAEKDKLLDDMMEGKVDTVPMNRSPIPAILHYAFYCVLFAYFFKFVLNISSLYCLIWLITALFPIFMTVVERLNTSLHEFMLLQDFNFSNLSRFVSESISIGAAGTMDQIANLAIEANKKLERLQEVGQEMGHEVARARDWHYDRSRSRSKVDGLAQQEFLSLAEDDRHGMGGMDVASDAELFDPMESYDSNATGGFASVI